VNILILDDQRSARHALKARLAAFPGTETCEAATLDEARALLASRPIDLALIDLRLSDDPRNQDGMTLVRELSERGEVTAVMVTGSNEMTEIRAAMRHGAYDYILKEDLSAELIAALVRDVRAHRLRAQEAPRPPRPQGPPDVLVGTSPAMVRLREVIRRVAPSSRPALVRGPTGAGKECVVTSIHRLSARPEAPLVVVNCGAIPESLIESQLFGHERGAFTGAVARHDGHFTTVGDGTLFLDEIAELPLLLQAKLLRVLESGRYTPVGATAERVFRGRVVAATHADLEDRVSKGTFREDLYYRLDVLVVQAPGLDDHPEDIPALAAHFAAESGRALSFSPEALDALRRRRWPGNVRELRNLVDRLAVFADDDLITPEVLRVVAEGGRRPESPQRLQSLDAVLDAVLALDLTDKFEALKAGLIEEALRRAGGNKSAAARSLGIHRKALDRMLDRLADRSGSDDQEE